MQHPVFRSLDHFAIVVNDTERSLETWRDQIGLKVLYSEVVNDGAVRLTHLDLGNTQLQLVEPLVEDHPLKKWLNENGEGLHHFCMKVDNVDSAMSELPGMGLPTAVNAHQGTQGKRAVFVNADATDGINVEVTGE